MSVGSGLLPYFAIGTLLFLFWVYGIASFVRDCRRTYLPAVRRWRARRRTVEQGDREREEAERELY